MTLMSRRDVLRRGGSASLAGLAVLLPPELLVRQHAWWEGPDTSADWLAFTDHEAAVVEEATARLIPGPKDDPAEAGHPGAREARVVRYIDTLLGAFSVTPAKIFAGGPFSNRHQSGAGVDDMAQFIGLPPSQAHGWRVRIAGYRRAYSAGVAALDRLTGGDFSMAGNDTRDAALTKNPGGFTSLLFEHAIEGMYSVPEYGGNRGLVGWADIHFPGDSQPVGYSAHEVSRSDGPDRYRPAGIAATLLTLMRESSGQ
jgi:hypothetical protein